VNRTFVGFDFGLKRIGIAVGSDGTGAARPLTTAANHAQPDWRAIDRVIADWAPAALVLGVPYNADGSAHAVTSAAQRFGDELGQRYRLPVHTTDERYSSAAAHDALVERRGRGDHRRIRRADIDAAAAAVILTGWLATAHNDKGDARDE
jgi:putative holliday junction resolvase